MENKQYIVSVEIGSSKIVGTLGEKDKQGAISVIAIACEKLTTDCVRRGLVQNVEEAKAHVSRILEQLEAQIAPTKIAGVYVGIAGRSLHNVPIEVSQNLDTNQPVSERTVNALSQRAADSSVEGEVLAVTPVIYVLDGKQETRNPIGSYSSSITARLNLIVAKTALKTNLHRVFDSITKVKGFIITPLAVGDKTLNSDERQLGCMLVDFGAETTTVSIYKNEALQYLATLPMGSRHITLDIASMSIVEAKAEDLKHSVGNAMELDIKDNQVIDGVRVNDVSSFVMARVGEIGANISQQLNYAGMSTDDITAGGVVLVGAGSRLNGFESFIAKTLKVKVSKGQHCGFVNLLDHNAENFEFIQSVALFATAAETIAAGDSCGLTPEVERVDPPEAEEEAVPETPKKPKKPGVLKRFFGKIGDAASDVFNSSDEGDNYSEEEEEKSEKY